MGSVSIMYVNCTTCAEPSMWPSHFSICYRIIENYNLLYIFIALLGIEMKERHLYSCNRKQTAAKGFGSFVVIEVVCVNRAHQPFFSSFFFFLLSSYQTGELRINKVDSSFRIHLSIWLHALRAVDLETKGPKVA